MNETLIKETVSSKIELVNIKETTEEGVKFHRYRKIKGVTLIPLSDCPKILELSKKTLSKKISEGRVNSYDSMGRRFEKGEVAHGVKRYLALEEFLEAS